MTAAEHAYYASCAAEEAGAQDARCDQHYIAALSAVAQAHAAAALALSATDRESGMVVYTRSAS